MINERTQPYVAGAVSIIIIIINNIRGFTPKKDYVRPMGSGYAPISRFFDSLVPVSRLVYTAGALQNFYYLHYKTSGA